MAEEALAEQIKMLRESQDEMARRVERSNGMKDSYHFKRKANEVQHKFNEDVGDSLEEAEDALLRAGPSEVVNTAQTHIYTTQNNDNIQHK